jgi:hypothetical protein
MEVEMRLEMRRAREDASGRSKTRHKGTDQSSQRRAMECRCTGLMNKCGATYDWALDLEPLALPPDLPPVIVKVFVWGG